MDTALLRTVSDIISQIEHRIQDNSLSVEHARNYILRLNAAKRQLFRIFLHTNAQTINDFIVCIENVCSALEDMNTDAARTHGSGMNLDREYTGN